MIGKVIVAGNVDGKSIEKLNKLNVEIFKTKKCNDVYEEISYHPDIQMFLDNNKIIISPNMYDNYIKNLENEKILIDKGISYLNSKYPENIMYNACVVGKYFIHNLKYTDKKILEDIEKQGYKLMNIKQGYSKCSISIVDENSIITSDRGIEKELSKYLDVLYVEPDENITLGNMQGFIGGATGLINDKWCINGDINRLKECNKIVDFVTSKKKEIICLNNNQIEDIGSILFIKY